MVLTKILVSAAFAVSGVFAQGSCGSSRTLEIQNQGDATSALGSCTEYEGNIKIATNTADRINLPNVRVINGDLIVDGATNLTGLSGESLRGIRGKFELNDLQLLTSTSFPELIQVGEINFQGLPNLASLGFTRNVQQVSRLNIQNTFLSSLTGINLQNVNNIYVANNRMLQSLSFQVTRIAGAIILEGNGDQFDAAFPNLESAQNITLRTCRSISIPSLKNVTGNLGFYENKMQTLEANNLTIVGQTVAINANPNIKNVSMPLLRTIGGGFQVQNNTNLVEADFPSVERIGGAFDFYGGFDKVATPKLIDVRGGFNLQSSGEVDCAPFKDQAGPNKVIKGTFKCYNKVSNPGNAKNNPNGGNGSKSAASFMSANIGAVSLAGGMAAIMAML